MNKINEKSKTNTSNLIQEHSRCIIEIEEILKDILPEIESKLEKYSLLDVNENEFEYLCQIKKLINVIKESEKLL